MNSTLKINWSVSALSLASLVVLGPLSGRASSNLVANGDFEINGGTGQIGNYTTLANWTVGAATDSSPSANVNVGDNSADANGFNGNFGTIQLWGPNTPVGFSINTLSNPSPHPYGPVNNGFSADGGVGNYLAASATYANAPISQTISGLTVGETYDFMFDYAGAQGVDSLGVNTEGWHVTLGTDTLDTSTLFNASEGFTGWQNYDTTITATSTSETLTFEATGGPSGANAYSLLDNVSLTAIAPTPEPATLALGALGAAAWLLRRRK